MEKCPRVRYISHRDNNGNSVVRLPITEKSNAVSNSVYFNAVIYISDTHTAQLFEALH